MMLADGWQIFRVHSLGPPRPERVNFSGGRNLSAEKRNAKARNDARRVYIILGERRIIVPDWFYPEFMLGLERALQPAPGAAKEKP